MKIKCFTLAEVLITLTVIGIVAAMTIPSLLTAMNSKIWKNRQEVFDKKMIQGLNLFNNAENGLSGAVYTNTEEFLKQLSKHHKILQICGAKNLEKCFSYSEIGTETEDKKIKTYLLSKLTTADSLGIDGDKFLEPAAFIDATGVASIISVKKDCLLDPDVPIKDIKSNECIAMLTDLNGPKKPNIVNKDIVSYGGMNPEGYFMLINGVKIALRASNSSSLGINESTCLGEIEKDYGITSCKAGNNGWAGSMKYCHDNNAHLVTAEELAKIVTGLCYTEQGNTINLGPTDYLSDAHKCIYNRDKAVRLGVASKTWGGSNIPIVMSERHERSFNLKNGYLRSSYCTTEACSGNLGNRGVICVSNE